MIFDAKFIAPYCEFAGQDESKAMTTNRHESKVTHLKRSEVGVNYPMYLNCSL